MNHLIVVALSLSLGSGLSVARTAHPPAAPAAPAAATASAPTAVATAGGTEPGTPQRSKMKTCNADARTKDLHGPDRKAFMKQCLSGRNKPAAAS